MTVPQENIPEAANNNDHFPQAPKNSENPEISEEEAEAEVKSVSPDDIENFDASDIEEAAAQLVIKVRQMEGTQKLQEWWNGLSPEEQDKAILNDGVFMKLLKRVTPIYGMYYSMYKEPKASVLRGLIYYGVLDTNEAVISKVQNDEAAMEKGAALLLTVASKFYPELKILDVPLKVAVAAFQKNRDMSEAIRTIIKTHEEAMEASKAA